MIEARGLTRFYGERAAVSNLSFTVRPGVVTGFLGPNGAGKSTTMRLILGLDAPTAGDVRVNGRHYADHPAPLAEVGALLEARAIHPGRSARNHLLALAATHAISARRVDQVLGLTALTDVANRDRREAGGVRGHGEDARGQHLGQARPAQPGAGRDLRLRHGPGPVAQPRGNGLHGRPEPIPERDRAGPAVKQCPRSGAGVQLAVDAVRVEAAAVGDLGR